MHRLLIVLFPLALLVGVWNDNATPNNWQVERLSPTAPLPWPKAGLCDFVGGEINEFRCGVDAGVVIQEADGQRLQVTGPLRIILAQKK